MDAIKAKITGPEDPFDLVREDLQATKDFAVNNIVSTYLWSQVQIKTEYKQLEEPALYNLNLKGKNFRSAIMFMLSRAIYNNNPKYQTHRKFEESRFYLQTKALAACIEIAHNASLLQDDIIDKADSRRS